MVTLLLAIIAILLIFLVCLFDIFFMIVPRVDTPKPDEMPQTPEPIDSIVGKTYSEKLVPPPPPIPAAQIGKRDLDDAFIHTEFSSEFTDDESNSDDDDAEDISEAEKREVLNIEGRDAHIENEQLQRKQCLDYSQISDCVRKVARNETLNIEDDETMRKLEGTDIDLKLKELLPTYRAIVAERLANAKY